MLDKTLDLTSGMHRTVPINLVEIVLYLLLRCPRGLSGIEFAKELMQEKVLVVPGEVMGLPGHIRLSLTCSDAMIEFALPVFKQLMKESTFQHGINHG